MNLSAEYIDRCAAETGYLPAPLEKVIRLGEMAADISRHPFLRNSLLLKGGTALNLCFGAPRRLSVDLDYNYVGSAEREKMLKERPALESAVIELAKRQGHRVQLSADTFAGRKIFLAYRSVFGPDERIEVDLNFLFRVPLVSAQVLPLWQPGGLDQPMLRVVSMEELIAGKLLALLGRSAPRDVWDVGNLPETAAKVMKSPLFRALFIALAITLEHPLKTYDQKHIHRSMSENDIARQLAPMLIVNANIRPEELVQDAWNAIKHLVNLKKNEEEFYSSAERGLLRAELLFPGDQELAERIASHPALLWKVNNVRAHLSRTGKETRSDSL
jgi:predicted nucleotidyltransferase component of viral defense system